MSKTIRFPIPFTTSVISPPELADIITILPATTTLQTGGAANYVDVRRWKQAGESNESPFICVALEFRTSAPVILGNGTDQLIGLYGQVNLTTTFPTQANHRIRQLIAILGLNIGAALPQIVVVNQTAGDVVGTTLLVNNVAAYDALSIGSVQGTITVPELATVTVVARPIREKNFIG